ncbi:MAG: formate dehydrogenase subunit gamma [Hyphomicrobiaceae bacterium]
MMRFADRSPRRQAPLPSRLRTALQALAVVMLGCLMMVSPAAAQTGPTTVNPTAESVKEQQLLDALKAGGPNAPTSIGGRVSIPDKQSGKLIQPAGQDWRSFHQGTLRLVGAAAILGMLALITLFFMKRGRIRIGSGFSGQLVVRFGGLDRFAHWLTAVSFILLGLSGLNLTFGKSVLMPFIGPEAFTKVTLAGKLVHNYVSFAFALGLILMFVLWVKDNFPHPRDIVWLVKGGGLVGSAHPPAGRFNLGQKLIFWSVILGGAGIAWSGYLLMFPFQFGDVAAMQFAGSVHGLLGLILIAIIIAHVYIGTLGMQGAFSAMGSGKVDVNWAREHHSVWADKVIGPANQKASAPRPTPAE